MTSAFRAKPVMSHPSKDGSIDGNAMFFFLTESGSLQDVSSLTRDRTRGQQ